jgi:hypothetical protein
MTIPGPPKVDTPRLCFNDWSHQNQAAIDHEREDQWVNPCNKPNCRNVHVENLYPGLISQESIRYQIVNHHYNRPRAVRTLIALAEKQKEVFTNEVVPRT